MCYIFKLKFLLLWEIVPRCCWFTVFLKNRQNGMDVNYNYFFSLEWKETKRPLKVLHGIHEVEEMRVQILLVTLHSQTNHLNLVSIHLVKRLGVKLIIHSDLPKHCRCFGWSYFAMVDLKIRVLRTRKPFWGPDVYYIRSALNTELCPFVSNNLEIQNRQREAKYKILRCVQEPNSS